MPETTILDLLKSLLLALRADIKPALDSDYASLRADLIDMVLSRLAVVMEEQQADLLLDTKLLETDKLISTFLEGSDNATEGLKQEIMAAVRNCASSEQLRRSETESRISKVLSLTPLSSETRSKKSYSAEKITHYLRSRFSDSPDLQVTGVEPIPGGRSKGTVLLELQDREGPKTLVIRHDFENFVTGSSVTYEYPILINLWQNGIKVPQPLFLETEDPLFGGAFIALEKVEGKAMGNMFSSTAPPLLIKQFAENLARIHSIDVARGDIANNLKWGDEPNPVRTMLEANLKKYKELNQKHPLLEHAFAWLFLHVDAIDYKKALIHGDAGLHNALGTETAVTSILDWELAHAGDPAEDLCYCRDVVESNMPWQDFISAYTAAGGESIPENRITFFTIWRSVQLTIQTLTAHHLFCSGEDQDLRLAAIAFNTSPKFLNRLAADLNRFCSTSN